jgi:hypothetical protein
MIPVRTVRPEMADQGAKPAEKRGWHPRVSLKVSLVAISLFTVAMTAASVHVPWFLVSRDNVAEMARQLNTEIVSGVNREVSSIFESAIAAQSALRDSLLDGVINLEDKRSRDRLFLALLRANQHFSWVSFGKPNGDFYGAQRIDELHLRVAESIWSAERKEATRLEGVLRQRWRASQLYRREVPGDGLLCAGPLVVPAGDRQSGRAYLDRHLCLRCQPQARPEHRHYAEGARDR